MILLFCMSMAGAQDVATEAVPWEIDWAFRDKESTNVARVGNGLVVAGLVLAAGSTSSDFGIAVATAGGTGAIVGPGVVAGGSLRARRSLTEQGIAVSPAAGFTSWGLYGLSMGAILAAEPIDSAGGDSLALIATVGLGGYIGSLIAANMQLGVNRRARHRSGRGSDIQRRPIE